MMGIQQIHTKEDYEAALKEVEVLMDTALPDSPEEERLDALADLVVAYERREEIRIDFE